MQQRTDSWDWDAWLDRTDEHVLSLLHRLSENREARAPARESPGQIDPETGHLKGGELCWVCYSTTTYRARLMPSFRACWWCLGYDKRQASKLGLKMLLPLMEWHSQPILPGHRYPADPSVVRVLEGVWGSSQILDEWRHEHVRREFALLADRHTGSVHLADWYEFLGYGWHRSQERWTHFVDLYFPALRLLLDSQGRS